MKILRTIHIAALGLAVVGGIAMVQHHASAQASSVVLQTAYQDSHDVTTTQSNTLHAIVQNMTGTGQNVFVKLELYNSSGQKIAEQGYNNVWVDPYNIATKTLTTPSNLAVGTYTWKVGIFNQSSWSVMAWYDNALQFNVYNPNGWQQGTSGDVTLAQGSLLGEYHYGQCPPFIARLSNSGSQPKNVLVDIELRNSSGQLINQYSQDNVSVPGQSSNVTVANQCSGLLANDTYSYSVGVFNPAWNGLLHWYSGVQTFTITQRPSATITVAQVGRPKYNPAVGSSFSVEPFLVSVNQTLNDATVKVFLVNGQGTMTYATTYMHQTLPSNSATEFQLNVPNAQAGTYTIETTVSDHSGNTLATFSNLGIIVVQ